MATYSITPSAGTIVPYYSSTLFQITSSALTSSDGVFARILNSSGSIIGVVGYIKMDSGAFSVTPSDCVWNPGESVSHAVYLQIYTNLGSGDDACEIDARYPLAFYTPCEAPTSVLINGSASNTIGYTEKATLSWSGANGGVNNSITGYRLFYQDSTNGSSWSGWYEYKYVSSTSSSGSTEVDLGSVGTYRMFGVATIGSAGESYGSSIASSPAIQRVNRTACTAPTSVVLAATSSTGENVRLSWSGASAGVGNSIAGYEVQRRESADGSSWGSWSSLGTTTSTNTNVTPPTTAGNYYQYQVRTLGSAGASYNSDWKLSSNTLRRSYTACGAPTSCSLSSTLSTGNVTLSWSGATAGYGNSIIGYKIQRCESSDGSSWGSWADLTTVSSTSTSASLTVSPPSTAGNYYKYRVLTIGSAGSSYYSGYKESTNTLRRDWTACSAPTACAVDSTLSLVATTLRWSGATAGYGNPISKYEVQRRSQAPGGSWSAWSAFETTSGTSLSVSPPATAGHYYQYRVRAQGTAGEAYYSSWKESTNTLRKAHKAIPAFTDPTLIVGHTDVKAVHITELQNVMNDILLPFMGVNTVAFTELERDSDAKHWGDHVQEIKAAIDSTGFSHEAWVTMQDEVTADVIEQLRRIVKSM